MNHYSKKNKMQRNIVIKFDELGFSDNVMKAIKDAGYETPTEIQAQAIPAILMTKDVVGIAQTGTGKTASFTLPMIEILAGGRARMRMPRALVLTPTRELAAQVAENFDKYGKYGPLKKALLVGGVSANDQIKALEAGVDVLIATPGRLLDLFERGNILLSDVKMLVIDEADRMMDMGFIPDIEKIIKLLPQFRQTLLFSATMPDEIKKLTAKFMSNPKTIAASVADKPAETVTQTLIWTSARNKKKVLGNILSRTDVKNGFIFCNRKKDIASLVKWLKDRGESAAGLHGDMQQSKRTETLEDFKHDRIKLMVCSDVAARGLDIKGVSHVFNYDVPFNAEDYVHRIGRTGRAGMEGEAYTIAVEDTDEKFVSAIEGIIKKALPLDNSFASHSEGKKTEAHKPQASENGSDRKPASHSKTPRSEHKDHKVTPEKHRSKNNNRHSDPDVVGFGDEIPPFMLRSC